jgi:hypothetical protein
VCVCARARREDGRRRRRAIRRLLRAAPLLSDADGAPSLARGAPFRPPSPNRRINHDHPDHNKLLHRVPFGPLTEYTVGAARARGRERGTRARSSGMDPSARGPQDPGADHTSWVRWMIHFYTRALAPSPDNVAPREPRARGCS